MATSTLHQNAPPSIEHPAGSPTVADPIADYVRLWQHLEQIHHEYSLTEEGWSFLTDHLQRPIEMRLMDRRPKTLSGVAACLEMASGIVDQFEREGVNADVAWYRRLLKHLIESAQQTIAVLPATARNRDATPRPDGMDLSHEPRATTKHTCAKAEASLGVFNRNDTNLQENER